MSERMKDERFAVCDGHFKAGFPDWDSGDSAPYFTEVWQALKAERIWADKMEALFDDRAKRVIELHDHIKELESENKIRFDALQDFKAKNTKLEAQLGPWRRVDDDDNWQCVECEHFVNRGIYPTNWSHDKSCSWNTVQPVIERAENAEAQIMAMKSLFESSTKRDGDLIVKLRIAVASTHYHHKKYEPLCRHCQAASEEIDKILE